jgi:hypothetical protein
MKILYSLIITFCLTIAGCASVGDALTPSSTIMDLGSAKLVSQQVAPVSSTANHGLGFMWATTTPDTVIIEAKVHSSIGGYLGSKPTDVVFDADGKTITCASKQNKIEGGIESTVFSVSMDEFLAIANAKIVTMRITQYDKNTESKFGTEIPESFIGSRFQEFLTKIHEVRDGG